LGSFPALHRNQQIADAARIARSCKVLAGAVYRLAKVPGRSCHCELLQVELHFGRTRGSIRENFRASVAVDQFGPVGRFSGGPMFFE